MKTYKGQELIKAAKYLQKMGSVRSKIEQEFKPVFTYIQDMIDDLEKYLKYKGFAPKA